jgi:hypothetical protein
MFNGKDVHAAWAYAESESTVRRGFQPSEQLPWDRLPESAQAKYELMAEHLNGMDKVVQELIALTYARRDWHGYPHYQEHVAPVEDRIEQKLEEMGYSLDVSWDAQSHMYGLFPRLYPENSKE